MPGNGRGWLGMAGDDWIWNGGDGFYARDLKRGALALRDFYNYLIYASILFIAHSQAMA